MARRRGSSGGRRATGLPVTGVTIGGPASQAGLLADDVIVALDEMPVGSAREMAQRIAMLEPGRRVTLGVRRDGIRLGLEAVVGRRPPPAQTQKLRPRCRRSQGRACPPTQRARPALRPPRESRHSDRARQIPPANSR